MTCAAWCWGWGVCWLGVAVCDTWAFSKSTMWVDAVSFACMPALFSPWPLSRTSSKFVCFVFLFICFLFINTKRNNSDGQIGRCTDIQMLHQLIDWQTATQISWLIRLLECWDMLTFCHPCSCCVTFAWRRRSVALRERGVSDDCMRDSLFIISMNLIT